MNIPLPSETNFESGSCSKNNLKNNLKEHLENDLDLATGSDTTAGRQPAWHVLLPESALTAKNPSQCDPQHVRATRDLARVAGARGNL
jgi:hypothetical protein